MKPKWLLLLGGTAGLAVTGARVAQAARAVAGLRTGLRPPVADSPATPPPEAPRRRGSRLPLGLAAVLGLTLFLAPAFADVAPPGLPTLGQLAEQLNPAQVEGPENPHGPLDPDTGKCAACHASHTAPEPGLLTAPKNEVAQNQVCTRCHGPEGEAQQVSTHSNKDYSGATQDPFYELCTDCHDPHSTPNDASGDGVNDHLILTSIGSLTVHLDAESGENSYDDGFDDGDHDSICVVCHTTTTHNTNTSTELRGQGHNPVGTDCISCHSHGDDRSARSGLMPTGGDCLGCHSSAQGDRRQIVDDQQNGQGSGGDFVRSSHHVQPATGTVTQADCLVCHDTSQHQGGAVRLRDPDSPDDVIVYTDGSSLEPFCVNCHDADGAAGNTAPFSDNEEVPALPAGWAASAHKTDAESPVTCFGDGTTGCHGNGHGSNLRRLLATYDGSPGEGNVNEEEGFCYTCHDSDGPASSDVQGQFGETSHHIVDGADGTQLECVNCHNPHNATDAAPLADPDAPDTPWAGSEGDFCLRCHDGDPPSGVVFPASAPGTGWDKSAMAGTTHDANLGGVCTSCHEAHGADYQSLLPGRYDRVYQEYDAAAYGLCWTCHAQQAVIEDKNAFDERHKKHVKSEESPCVFCHDTHAPYDAGESGLIDFGYAEDNAGDSYLSWEEHSYDLSSAFVDTGENEGECYLRCHDEKHDPEDYEGEEVSTTSGTGAATSLTRALPTATATIHLSPPATPSPTASPTPSPTPLASATPSPTPTASPTPPLTPTPSPTASPTPSDTPSPTPTVSPTPSLTPTPTPTPVLSPHFHLDGEEDLAVFGDAPGDGAGYALATGDINGDGQDDLIIGARHADGGERNDVGKTYVIFGTADLPPVLDLSTDRADLVVIGRAPDDQSGYAVAAADLNGDGSDDLIISAPGADPADPDWADGAALPTLENAARSEAGETYVIYGGESLPSLIDLTSDSADVTIVGAASSDRSGSALATGDVNGDDTDDLIIAAPYADAPDRGDAGAAHVVFGSGSLPSVIDLSSSADFTLYGNEAYDYSGSALASGDLNDDGVDDLVVGAPGADAAVGDEAGKTYVLYGSPELSGALDLNASPADVTVAGGAAHDRLGRTLAAGDVNADGRADLAIGAPGADAPERSGAGAVYVFYGGSLPPSIDLSVTAADLVLMGDDEFDRAGEALAIGDGSGDGLGDLIVGVPAADPAAGVDAGETYLVHGRSDLPDVLDLDSTPAGLTVFGGQGGDRSGSALVAGDVNADGAGDLIIAAPAADSGRGDDAGAVFALYGEAEATPTPTLTPTSTPTTTPTPTSTPTSTSTPIPTPTLTSTPTSTPTPTPTPTPTSTPTSTPTPTPTLTSTPTSTPTPTPFITPSSTPSPTATPPPTGTPAP